MIRIIEPPAIAVEDPQDEIAALVRQLHETQQRLQELAGGEVDAVVHPGGHSYMLHEAQEKLRKNEAALQRQQTELRVLFDFLPAMIAFKDTENGILRVNQRLAESVGKSVEEIEGKSMCEIYPHDAAKFYADDLEIIHSGLPKLGIIETFHDQEDCEVWIQTDKVPVCDLDGKVTGLIIMAQDITERQRAATLLLESRQRLALATESARLGIWEWEVVTNKLVWDAQMYALYGIREENFSGAYEAWRSGVHPDDRERSEAELFAAVDGVNGFHAEFRIVRPGGEVRDIEAHAVMQRADGDSSRRMIGVNWDITERKLSEKRIAEQAALIDEARDAIVVRDLEHRITFWNKGAERVYGWTADEARGSLLNKLLAIDSDRFAEVDRIVRGIGAWNGEIEKTARNDTVLTIDCRWTLVRDAHGQPRSILSIDTDITERRKIERQFLRAQRMESIGTLAGGIAHDLNNCLGPIIMALDLLATKFIDPESAELLQIVSASACRGADMVRQVLGFARGVEGERQELQMRHLVRDVEKIVKDTFLKHIELRTSLPNDLWTVVGDATQLHQVLLNLCVNARDAMPEGGKLIISVENLTLDAQYAGLNSEAHPGAYIVLQVEDSGTGMPPEIIEKIFDPFFTTKEVGKGTGLGLSTSMAIVKSHGGFVRVYSEPGKGTTFKVYLPAHADLFSTAPIERVVELPRGHGELILVVDDEPSVRLVTQQTLEAFGYRVVLACDGAEAVAAYATRGAEIAVVLTDMRMPVMDGPATIQVLRKLNPKLPIIAASGLTANDYVAKFASLGVQHFLSKPYTAETLLKVLKLILEEKA